VPPAEALFCQNAKAATDGSDRPSCKQIGVHRIGRGAELVCPRSSNHVDKRLRGRHSQLGSTKVQLASPSGHEGLSPKNARGCILSRLIAPSSDADACGSSQRGSVYGNSAPVVEDTYFHLGDGPGQNKVSRKHAFKNPLTV
jgi:hypothetical protein